MPGTILWQCNSPSAVFATVTLDSDAWLHAINGHPEIAPHIEAAKVAVESPSAVYQSLTKPGSYLFFNGNVYDSNGNVLAVPVAIEGFSGVVTSVYFRGANYSGRRLWP